ncbi:MAG: hypothetical protein CSA76_01740 [Spirochaetales bacterium]|nr:MAG: hypothetical protein CSA76_01740 [Spirochaetales bacterium]
MDAVERFAELIRMPTVSSDSPEHEDEAVFKAVPGRIAELYPDLHRVMERELPGDRAILYHWKGSQPDLLPVMGMAHFDVVPPGDFSKWEHPPFDGVVENGVLHGRGTLDDKGMLAGWLEAANRLAAEGYQPRRSLYLAFGGDEETTGKRGAGHMAQLFAERGMRFAFILDEGGAVAVDQLASFTSREVALLGIAEKGFLTLRIKARGMPGHASAPPSHTAVGRLSAAILALENTPAPASIGHVPGGMLRALGSVSGGLQGLILKNNRFFGGILKNMLSASSGTAPMVRTTLAPTVIRGGERDNVLPDEVEALVNMRILPGETIAGNVKRVQSIIEDAVDEGVTVEIVENSAFEPVPSGGAEGHWWKAMERQVERCFPGALSAPYLMTATTDSRWYRNLSDAIFRFIPMRIDKDSMKTVHAPNEAVSLEEWGTMVNFLEGLLKDVLADESREKK